MKRRHFPVGPGLLLGVVMIISFSCHENKDDSSIQKLEIKNTTATTKVTLSDLKVTDIKYIPLETTPESFIEGINKVLYDGGNYFIQSKDGVMKFDSGGQFICPIGHKGRGPHEYIYCTDFSIDKKNKLVYILDATTARIYVYDEDGNGIKTFHTPHHGTYLTCVDDGILCFNINPNGDVDYSFDFISNDGKEVQSYPNKYKFKYRANGVVVGTEYLNYQWNESLFTKELYSDTIFSFSNRKFTPKLILVRNEKLFPVKLKEEITMDNMFTIRDNYILDYRLLRFSSYLYLVYGYHRKGYGLICNMDDDTQYLFNPADGITNDFDSGMNLYPETTLDGNTILSWIGPLKLKAHITTEAFKNSIPKYPEKKKELEKLASNLNENDNPVLMLVKLKE